MGGGMRPRGAAQRRVPSWPRARLRTPGSVVWGFATGQDRSAQLGGPRGGGTSPRGCASGAGRWQAGGLTWHMAEDLCRVSP